jgi:ankyrin repeat protein
MYQFFLSNLSSFEADNEKYPFRNVIDVNDDENIRSVLGTVLTSTPRDDKIQKVFKRALVSKHTSVIRVLCNDYGMSASIPLIVTTQHSTTTLYPLSYAAHIGDNETISLLVRELGYPLLELSSYALETTVFTNQLETFKLLLSLGMNPFALTSQGDTLLQLSAQLGRCNFIEYLLASSNQFNYDVNEVCNGGTDALTLSIIHIQHDAFLSLVEFGADLGAHDYILRISRSALHEPDPLLEDIETLLKLRMCEGHELDTILRCGLYLRSSLKSGGHSFVFCSIPQSKVRPKHWFRSVAPTLQHQLKDYAKEYLKNEYFCQYVVRNAFVNTEGTHSDCFIVDVLKCICVCIQQLKRSESFIVFDTVLTFD